MEFYIYRNLIYHLSALFNIIFKGLQEFLKGCIIWEDVNSDVFSHFVQFLYTGIYTRSTFLENTNLNNLIILQTESTYYIKPFEQVVNHIQTWILTDKYAINLLKDFVYLFLADNLVRWTISPSAFIPDFKRFVRYIYNIYMIGEQQLQRLVIQFTIYIVKDISSLNDWEILLEVSGFTIDLIEQIII